MLYSSKINVNSPSLFKEAGLTDDLRQILVDAYRDIELTYSLSHSDGESEFRLLPSAKKQEINIMGQKMDL